MKASIPLTVKCLFCDRRFKSVEARVSHERAKHPPLVIDEPLPELGQDAADSYRYFYMGFFG